MKTMTETKTDLTTTTTTPEDLANMSEEDLRKLYGQSDARPKSKGLSRLGIQKEPEDDNGNAVPWGNWYVFDPEQSKTIYGEVAIFRPFIRKYQYNHWDNENELFESSVQLTSLFGEFYDTRGTFKLGKLSGKERALLDPESPEMAIQNSVKCVQVMYGVVTIVDGVDAEGNPASCESVPCMWNAKGGNFMPLSDFLKALDKQGKSMWNANIKLETSKHKKGKNTYFNAVISGGGEEKFTDEDFALRTKFAESVEGVNAWIMEKYNNASVPEMDVVDDDLLQQMED